MPYVLKDRKPPAPWFEVRARTARWKLPFAAGDWVCEQVAYRLSQWSFLEVLEYAGTLSILLAAVAYFAEADQRRQQKHYQAWQVINTAQGKGGNGGRVDALQQLNEDHVSLTGVDVSDAFLQNVRLESAELRRADMRGADMRGARLRRAVLQDANFRDTNLRGADLRDADLSSATMHAADLTAADLSRAKLAGARFDQADLRDADLSAVIDWQSIQDIRLANLHGVKHAPEGFLAWATAHGAVDIASDEQWNDAIRKVPERE